MHANVPFAGLALTTACVDFWGQLVNDYETIVKRHPKNVARRIQAGIPDRLRGMVWQLISHALDPELEMVYSELLKRESSHEKVIRLDLPRTFPNHEYFRDKDGAGQNALYNVVRAYSLFDQEVGYCQGIPFIVGPLLIHMAEDEAFCTLVRLMQFYNLRGHYTPSMEDLHMRLYQFEKLLEVHHPDLSRHLNAQGIQTTMYASQWYMTFFAYKFPLSMVYRIIDIIFAEGVESLHRFAVALMRANRARLLLLNFEDLLTFLKNGLFDIYQSQEVKLVQDATNVKVTAKQLDQWACEYHQEARRLASEQSIIDSLRRECKRLEADLRRSEKQVAEMSEEQCQIASQLVQERVKLEDAMAREKALQEENLNLQKQLDDEREKGDERVKDQLDELIGWKSRLMMENAELEGQVKELETQVVATKMQLCMAEAEKMELQAAVGR
ncbi:rab-GTPase-TBC domain-containing protein [Thamnocephalis sphaerospora]|uniref:Rab-GTPase-TBC domain-containing protein n=1 Tax=Thamnocephalis sphaerospora TaxID=78915 RepID=A0A4P9XXU0_9FUNG|nr:rab-GTPase-TBC domain-containing protein [Thamnocephalis sphaerospora]|eukprot:RKP10230.1 rab-GTPase-TBC domain-containing protein [Thamnocephalis sphaerospora]